MQVKTELLSESDRALCRDRFGLEAAIIDEAGLCRNGDKLLIPIPNLAGEPTGYIARKSNPDGSGDYKNPKGWPPCFSAIASERAKLADPSTILIVVESIIKALAVIQWLRRSGHADKFCVIAQNGVYGYRGKSAKGGAVTILTKLSGDQLALKRRV